jgi:hypothetical protein
MSKPMLFRTWSTPDLEEAIRSLEQAIASGEQSVSYPGGSVTYATQSEMSRTLERMYTTWEERTQSRPTRVTRIMVAGAHKGFGGMNPRTR